MSDVPARLLREALREHAAPAPSPACLDADTLGAWSDGTLRARDRAAAESHAAGCARCQAMLAAMTRIAPPPGEPRTTAQAPADASRAVPRLEEAVGVTPNANEAVRLRSGSAAAAPLAKAFAKTSSPLAEIVSPDANVRWRLNTAASVERS